MIEYDPDVLFGGLYNNKPFIKYVEGSKSTSSYGGGNVKFFKTYTPMTSSYASVDRVTAIKKGSSYCYAYMRGTNTYGGILMRFTCTSGGISPTTG